MLTDNMSGFVWDDYSEKYKDLISDWTDDEALKFAINTTWHDEYMYYLAEAEYEYNKGFFCKIVFDAETPIAVLILLTGDGFPVTVNPMIINPSLRGKGYGTEIVRQLISNIDELVPNHSDIIEAGVDIENTASRRIFEKNGFEMTKIHPGGDFVFYQYHLREV